MGINFCDCPNPCVNKEARVDKNLSRKMINEGYLSKQRNNRLTNNFENNLEIKNTLNQQHIKSRNLISNLDFEISKPSLIKNKNLSQIIGEEEKVNENENLNYSYFSDKVKSKKTNYEKSHIPKINKGHSLDKLIKNNSSHVTNQKQSINKTPNKFIDRN